MPKSTSTPAGRARELVVAGILIGVGLLNVIPGIALLLPGRLTTLYGIGDLDTDVLVLLRHRALLLAMLGVFLVLAAAQVGWRRPALVAGLVSNVVFVVLAVSVPTSAQIGRVATIDLIALPLLVVGLVLSARRATQPAVEPARTADVG